MIGKKVLDKLLRISDAWEETAIQVLSSQLQKTETKQWLANENRKQLNKSELSTGEPITPLYSPGYAAKKGTKKPDLRVTGAFQKSISVRVTKKQTTFLATDPKTEKLKKKYSDFILGLQTGKIPLLIEFILPDLRRDFKKEILRKF